MCYLPKKALPKPFRMPCAALKVEIGDLSSLLWGPELSSTVQFGDCLEGDKQAEEPYWLWASRVWHIHPFIQWVDSPSHPHT